MHRIGRIKNILIQALRMNTTLGETQSLTRIFSTFFKNNILTHELKELETNMTPEYILQVLSIDHIGNT